MPPLAKEAGPLANAVGARFHDDPGGTVSEHDRIGDRRRSAGEEPQGRIPPAVEEGIRRGATHIGELSAGTDRGAHVIPAGADPGEHAQLVVETEEFAQTETGVEMVAGTRGNLRPEHERTVHRRNVRLLGGCPAVVSMTEER